MVRSVRLGTQNLFPQVAQRLTGDRDRMMVVEVHKAAPDNAVLRAEVIAAGLTGGEGGFGDEDTDTLSHCVDQEDQIRPWLDDHDQIILDHNSMRRRRKGG